MPITVLQVMNVGYRMENKCVYLQSLYERSCAHLCRHSFGCGRSWLSKHSSSAGQGVWRRRIFSISSAMTRRSQRLPTVFTFPRIISPRYRSRFGTGVPIYNRIALLYFAVSLKTCGLNYLLGN